MALRWGISSPNVTLLLALLVYYATSTEPGRSVFRIPRAISPDLHPRPGPGARGPGARARPGPSESWVRMRVRTRARPGAGGALHSPARARRPGPCVAGPVLGKIRQCNLQMQSDNPEELVGLFAG